MRWYIILLSKASATFERQSESYHPLRDDTSLLVIAPARIEHLTLSNFHHFITGWRVAMRAVALKGATLVGQFPTPIFAYQLFHVSSPFAPLASAETLSLRWGTWLTMLFRSKLHL